MLDSYYHYRIVASASSAPSVQRVFCLRHACEEYGEQAIERVVERGTAPGWFEWLSVYSWPEISSMFWLSYHCCQCREEDTHVK